ncbi:hypothetical protein F0562_008647 [Nyssa sinensis]|uniref:Uncharacterized protein n=1 Tax=Nyssa sinensis TaxID=561372 RepID=A0A5J5AA80_9ASTE|nr:hypothetical protein F0562_008647 [Nyssa sinensis]
MSEGKVTSLVITPRQRLALVMKTSLDVTPQLGSDLDGNNLVQQYASVINGLGCDGLVIKAVSFNQFHREANSQPFSRGLAQGRKGLLDQYHFSILKLFETEEETLATRLSIS